MGDSLEHRRRHALDEAVHHSGPGPSLPAPGRTLREPLFERVHREIQESQERDLGAVEILVHVGPQVDLLEKKIDAAHGPQIEIDGPAELPPDLVEVSVHLLERLFEAREAFRPLDVIGDVLLHAERFERRFVAVGIPPPLGHLPDAAPDGGGVPFPMPRDQLGRGPLHGAWLDRGCRPGGRGRPGRGSLCLHARLSSCRGLNHGGSREEF